MLIYVLGEIKKNVSFKKDLNPSASKVSLDKIIAYIQKSFAYIDKIDYISSKFFVSSSHLSRIFKQNTGMSVMAYVNSIKLKHAAELLETTNLPINILAENCGFFSSSYFIKCFKKTMGMSPKEYRKTFHKEEKTED